MNDRFKNLLNDVVQDNANSVRDRASWEAASVVERETFGRVFNVIEGILALIAIFGCILLSGLTQNSRLLMYIVGIIWLIPFILLGTLLARFRHRLFVRIRGIINNFLGKR